jgi:hypothetical protein
MAAYQFSNGDQRVDIRAGLNSNAVLIDLNAPKASPTFTGLVSAEEIVLADTVLASYARGQIAYDPITKTNVSDTGFPGVRVNIGQEHMTRFFNDTGVTIANGTVINAQGIDATNDVIKGILADNSSPASSSAVIGIATADVLDQEVGVATKFGQVNDTRKTFGLSLGGPAYLGTGGGYTDTKPIYPAKTVIVGTVVMVATGSTTDDGIILAEITRFARPHLDKSYSFTSQGISSGTFYDAGFYDFPTTDANLTQASTTIAHGSANGAYGAHAGVIFGGAGVVDTGVVGLRVNGTSITDEGVRTTSDSDVITADITGVALDEYLESTKKWLGTITFELYVVSGSPVNYSLDFNYGLAKYEDFGNKNYSVVDFEVTGLAGASDSLFDVELLHHKTTGWSYAATGFVAGDGAIVQMSVDLSTDGNLVNGEWFAWKRSGLSTYIAGNNGNGTVVRITAGQNNSVQSMNVHIGAVGEDLT